MIRIFMVGYSDHKGGVETYIDNLCSKLNKDKYEVVYSAPKMVIDGKTWQRPSNRHRYISYRRFWKKFFSENKFDVIYYNACDIVCIDLLKFAKKAGIKVRIIHSHSTGIQQKLNLFHKISEKINHKVLGKYANLMFACSKSAGQWMFDDREFKIVKNGVDLDKYKFNAHNRDKIRKELGLTDEKIVVFIGRMSKLKNPIFAVEVAKELFKIKPNSKCIFIGDGELLSEAKAKVKEEKLENDFIFTGSINNVDEYLSAADCLIMPSEFEGLPFALVEAQASGLPCVVSDNVTNSADLTGLLEFLSLDDNVKTWANAINNKFLQDRKDTQKDMIKSGFSAQNTADFVMDCIEKTIKKA